MLGHGVDAPMPVMLLGALGGMVAAGILGIFSSAFHPRISATGMAIMTGPTPSWKARREADVRWSSI